MSDVRRPRSAALALAVALVLADSSIVVLALPEIYRELDTSVSAVTWVLISFNLVMALAAVPAAHLARRVGPGRAAAIGLAIFAGASLACGVSSELSTLIAARCVQALGGALAVTAVLELLPATVGSEQRATAIWAAAGATGAALGPAIGGLLTELVSWQSIFLVQVPIALVAAAPILAVARHEAATGIVETELRRTGRPHLLANLALALVSAAIAAALFLLVLLLIEGWRLTPIAAALVVTVMPLSALAGSRLGNWVPNTRTRAAAGAILVAGGLGGLALLPKAAIILTIPPQILVGVGLALVLSALTETALHGRSPQAIHGGWTISARHAGVVIGLLALTPIFTQDIAQQREDAIDAGTAVVLDSKVSPLLKLELAAADRRPAREREGQGADDRPGLRPASRRPGRAGGGGRAPRRTPGPARPRRDPRLQPVLRARRPARPAGADPDRPRPRQGGGAVIDRADRGKLLFLGSIAVSAVLVLSYLAAGGADYAPAKTADPCKPREWRDPEGLQQIAEQFSLSALDGAACKLGVSREALAQALASDEARQKFAEEYGIGEEELASAIRAGLLRAVDDAEEAGALSPLLGGPLRQALKSIPLDEAIELIQNAQSLLGNLDSFLGPAEGLLEQFIPGEGGEGGLLEQFLP